MDSESLQYTKSTMEQLLLMEKLSKGVYIYIYVWQPIAEGHRAYTDPSAAGIWGR